MYYNFNQNGLHCYILVLSQYLMKGFHGGYIPTTENKFTLQIVHCVYAVRTMIIRMYEKL